MTEKLYYTNAYQKEFDAEILSCSECEAGYDIVLDRTAFFPEEGGQTSDTGTLGQARVIHVYEKDGVIHHVTDSLPDDKRVMGIIDFDARFDKMQNHTAEHILCGIIHSLFGYENVGFHLGADEVTFDISEPLDRESLDKVEELANRAVFDNLEVRAYFPSSDELTSMNYRSKLELTENVRIVTVGDVDTCACCAPHVSRTGEIGLIKIIDSMRHRGGMRIWMAAGSRALTDFRATYSNLREISAALSVPKYESARALSEYMQETERLRSELKQAKKTMAEARAEGVLPTDKNAVCYLDGVGMEELRHFVNAALPKVGGILVALVGTEGDYKYLIASNSVNLSQEIRNANAALGGRGGGKPFAVQGSFSATLSEIKNYFLS